MATPIRAAGGDHKRAMKSDRVMPVRVSSNRRMVQFGLSQLLSELLEYRSSAFIFGHGK